jgi:hypothetical protein
MEEVAIKAVAIFLESFSKVAGQPLVHILDTGALLRLRDPFPARTYCSGFGG